MVHFVGAGPGAPDLITLRGAELLKKADCIIYAGSLVNPALLEMAKADCEIHNSATMTLEQVLDVIYRMEAARSSLLVAVGMAKWRFRVRMQSSHRRWNRYSRPR